MKRFRIVILAVILALVAIIIIYLSKGHIKTSYDKRQWIALIDLRNDLASYKRDVGAFPRGNNQDIAQQLLGENPLQKKYLTLQLIRLSTHGELLDPDGAPYLFRETPDGLMVTSQNFSEKDPQIIDYGPK